MEHDVFRALADPSRRLLLDALFERDGRSLGDLEALLPAMTRFGVMKHLRVLEDAGLVVSRKAGRSKLHYLNPVPIQQIAERWIDKFAAGRIAALTALRQHLEERPMQASATTSPAHVYEIYIGAPPDKVWQAIVDPTFTAQYFFGTLVDSSWTPGAPLAYRYPDGTLAADGEIVEIDPPRRLVHTFNAVWDDAVSADAAHTVTWELEPAGAAACKLTVLHDGFAGETATLEQVKGGMAVILGGLKTLLETGARLTLG